MFDKFKSHQKALRAVFVYCDKACARATSDWVIGCLTVAEDWTETVPLDQLFRESVSRVGLCITGMGKLCLINFKSGQ